MPKLLDYEAVCEPLEEVTSIKIMDKKKFHPEGLFSEQIFGPLRNYTCQCGTYYGASKSGGVCNICNVAIVNSDERRRRFAKIILPIPVINPILFDIVSKLGGSSLKKIIDELMRSETTVLYEDGNSFKLAESSDLPTDMRKWEGIEAIQHLVEEYSKDFDEDSEWSVVSENIEKLFIRQVIVLPPDLRPAAKGIEKNNQIVDQINRYYMQILMKKHIMSDTMINIRRDKKLFYHYFRQLQKDVNELYNHILDKLSKKEGLIRGNILGKRLDFSGRAVIAPDPTLELDQCSLPYLMVLELFKLQIAKQLILLDKYQLLNEAIDFVDECQETNNEILFPIAQDIVKNEVCFLNRQPSLHRLSLVAFKITTSNDSVIKLHPLACPGFNADFDGDQMAVYIPITTECKKEALEKCLITKTLSNPANGSLATTPSQDIVLGLYTLSNGAFDERLESEVEFRGQKVPERIKIINECFPTDYPIITDVIDKKKLYSILNDIKDNYDHEITKRVLDEVKKVGFKFSTLFGTSMSLDGCYIESASKIRDGIYSTGDVNKQLGRISSKSIVEKMKDKYKYSYMIESGARGSWDQARQMILSRGFISNFAGEILPIPIKNSMIDGLTEEEFFYSTYGARKGLLDVALNTASSGYLSRKLIFACANLQFDVDNEDCGTTDYLNVYVKDFKKAKMMVGKWMLKDDGVLDLITENNFDTIINHSINVRSPIFCKTEKICKKCYGEMHKFINTRFIGVIAAQSLGECNTQLVLRTFHTSGVAQVKEGSEDMKQQDVVNDLSLVSKLLHQFDSKKGTSSDLVASLFDVYNANKSINHTHFECVVSQLMWVENEKWRLIENRSELTPSFYSVQKVPSMESWLLGLAFSNPKRHILKGIFSRGNYTGILDKILRGEKVR